ncbi:MAG: BON domain-containing protein [Firmicutes bacterium]|nr:BON domain-containing protein [Bacillota bacterium]
MKLQDDLLCKRIGSAIKEDGFLSHCPITVNCLDGTAFLRGKVETPEQRIEAERIARHTYGVRSVVNELGFYRHSLRG